MEQSELIADLIESQDEPNKVARKKGLERFKKDASKLKDNSFSVFKQTFKLLIKSLSEESERCREISAQILCQFSNKLLAVEFEECLPYLIPTVRQRIGIEPSEEVRMELFVITQSIVEHNMAIDVHISDVFTVLQSCLLDPNPTMQAQVCSVVFSFAANYPDKFKFHANSLVNPLLPLVSHHQQKIRAASIKCLGKVVLHGGDLDKVYPVVTSRLTDESTKVRMELCEVAFMWIKCHPDKDYWISRLLPMALPLLLDESEEIRKLSADAWKSIGDEWGGDHEVIKETSNDTIGDEMMFPSSGCCNLVNKNQTLIYQIIAKELSDWICENRIVGIKLLFIVLCHVKNRSEDHLEEIVRCLLTAAKDEDKACVEMARKSSAVLGFYLSCSNYYELLLKSLKEDPSEEKLVILSGYLQGSKSIDKNVLKYISGVLIEEDICHSYIESYQKEFLRCITSMVVMADSSISFHLVVALLTVDGLAESQDVKHLAVAGIDKLCKQFNVDRETLFRREISPVLSKYRAESCAWTSSSSSILVFQAVLEQAGAALSTEIEVILNIFKNGLTLNIPDLSIKLLSILENLLANSDMTLNSSKRFYPYILPLTANLIQPVLVWHTGLSERKIRSIATTCLFHLAKLADKVPDLAGQLAKQIWHQVLALIEDEEDQVRFWICRTAAVFVKHLEHVNLVKSIKYLIERLDDAKKHVRAEALKVLIQIQNMDIDEEQASKIRKALHNKSL